MILAAASHDPLNHAVPHALHETPLEIEVGGADLDIPFFGIKNGVYEFFITNHLMMTAVVGFLLIVVGWVLSNRINIYHGEGLGRYQTKGRLAQLFETICAFVRDEIAAPNLHGLTDKYIYYIWTVFFFVMVSNVIGVIPIGYALRLITGNTHFEHFGGTATGNLALTSVLAFLTFVAIIYIGIKETGAKAFFNHFNPIGWDDVKMLPVSLLLYFLEWLGLLIKCFVLAMRLFGTMMAGHLVLAVFVGMIFSVQESLSSPGTTWGVAIAVTVVATCLTLLELFICLLQAFIFTFLSVLFISATAVHEHDDHLDHDPEALTDAAQMDPDKAFDPARLGPAV